MQLDHVLSLCRAQPGATEDYPFDMDTLVFRVMGKIFALTNEASQPKRVTLKCEPDLALELRDQALHVLRAFGNSAEPLRELARYIVERRS